MFGWNGLFHKAFSRGTEHRRIAMAAARKKNGHGAQNGQTVKGLQARMSSLRGDLDALQSDVRGLVGDAGIAAGEQVVGVVDDALQSAWRTADRVESWGSERMPQVRDVVAKKPFAACALALSAGALIGAILFRR